MRTFEETADWCELHLENNHGREVGMTFGAALRALERLRGTEHLPAQAVRLRSARAEELLLSFATRYIAARECRYVDHPRIATIENVLTNMTYDTGRG